MTGLGRNGYSTKIYRNDGDGVFTDIDAPLPGIRYGTAVAWGDYDNDGDLDLLITGESDQSELVARIYRNDGSGIFTDIEAGLPGVWIASVAWGDYNNDGNLDILLTGWAGVDRISRVYRNTGNDSFTDIHASLEGVYYGAAVWGDYDNDGDLDILITGKGANGGVTRLYRNDAADTFSDIHAPFPPLDESAAAWGDYDNDGDLDVILSRTPNSSYYARYWLFRDDAATPTRRLSRQAVSPPRPLTGSSRSPGTRPSTRKRLPPGSVTSLPGSTGRLPDHRGARQTEAPVFAGWQEWATPGCEHSRQCKA